MKGKREGGVVVVVMAAMMAACTNAAVDKAVGTTDETTGLAASRSATSVVVENGAGRPMLSIRAVIEDPAGEFVQVLPTLGAGQKADLRFADFRTEDGTLFDPAVARPKQIKVTARDTLANSYDVTVAWE